MKKNESGFSLIELLLVVAILGIVATIGAFSYSEVMRSYRAKNGVNALYDCFIKAKAHAAYKNADITVSYDKDTGVMDFTDQINNIVIARIIFSINSLDPNLRNDTNGNPISSYYFVPYCVIASNTRLGNNVVNGLFSDENNDGAYDKTVTAEDIPIYAEALIQPVIRSNGFIDISGGAIANEMSAILVMSQGDIEDASSPDDARQYFLTLFQKGLVKKSKLEPDGTSSAM